MSVFCWLQWQFSWIIILYFLFQTNYYTREVFPFTLFVIPTVSHKKKPSERHLKLQPNIEFLFASYSYLLLFTLLLVAKIKGIVLNIHIFINTQIAGAIEVNGCTRVIIYFWSSKEVIYQRLYVSLTIYSLNFLYWSLKFLDHIYK